MDFTDAFNKSAFSTFIMCVRPCREQTHDFSIAKVFELQCLFDRLDEGCVFFLFKNIFNILHFFSFLMSLEESVCTADDDSAQPIKTPHSWTFILI